MLNGLYASIFCGIDVTDIPTIDVRAELLDRHAGAIKGLYRLSTQVPIEKWALVGGLMVLILAYEHDTHSWRASQTKDADIVVDVVADLTVLSPKSMFSVPVTRLPRCSTPTTGFEVWPSRADDERYEVLVQ